MSIREKRKKPKKKEESKETLLSFHNPTPYFAPVFWHIISPSHSQRVIFARILLFSLNI